MKIVCDKCATKYSIADDKVRGKVFKIRCKKCSHIIVVKGTEGAGADGGDAGESDEGATIAAGAESPAGVSASAEKVWYLVVGGEQIGPLSAGDVGSKYSTGEIDSETYGWREGMGDWLRVGSIDELAATVGKNGANGAHGANGGETRRTDLNDMFAAQPAAADDSAGDDLFGAGRGGEARGGAGLLGATAADAGHDTKLTGQRNENSVLFSLSNLQAMATASAPSKSSASSPMAESRAGYATAKNEGSGLIDIRAMAAATLSAVSSSSSSSIGDSIGDLPSFSAAPVFSPVVQPPVMLPTQQSGTPKWVWAVVGIGGFAVLGCLAVIVVMLTGNRQPAPVAVAMNTPSTTPSGNALAVAAAPSGTAGTAPAALAGSPAAPAVAAVPAAIAAAPEAKAAEKEPKEARVKHAGAAGKPHSASPAPAVAPAPVAARPAAAPKEDPKPAARPAGKKKDDLDSLLDEAVAPGSAPKHAAKAPAAPAPDDSNLPEQLDRPTVMAGMKSARVQACFDQYKVPGTAIVAVLIGKAGKVKSANVGGALAGTPTGDCVSRAVKGVSFKPFKGADMSISYPFILR